LRLAAVLAQFWELRGRVNEGRGWLEEMLAATARTVSSAPRR
jgi:hypothetical protein